MGGDLVEEHQRAEPLIAPTNWACASARPISSAFCSPVEAVPAGMSFGPWRTRRSEACGPTRVRPAARSRCEPSRKVPVAVLGIDGRMGAPRAVDLALEAKVAKGKGEASSRVARISAAKALDGFAAGGRDRDRELRGLALDGVEPEACRRGRRGRGCGSAARSSAFTRAPCSDEPRAPAGRESAADRRRAAEERVEVGGEPDEPQVFGEGHWRRRAAPSMR